MRISVIQIIVLVSVGVLLYGKMPVEVKNKISKWRESLKRGKNER